MPQTTQPFDTVEGSITVNYRLPLVAAKIGDPIVVFIQSQTLFDHLARDLRGNIGDFRR